MELLSLRSLRISQKAKIFTSLFYSSSSSRTTPDTDSTQSDELLKRLNCPLCTNTFGYSFGLECHLLSVHQQELQLIREGGGRKLTQSCGCLCCAAQFLKLDTLVRHLLEDHKDFLLTSLTSFDFEFNPSQSLSRHFDCQFCGQKFLKRHQKLFLAHLEQKHLPDLALFVKNSDMVLFNIDSVENIEIKLLQSLSQKVRITAEKPRRSLSAQRVKSDRILDQSDRILDQNGPHYEQIQSSPHHYEIIASPQPILTSTIRRFKKKLRRSESTTAQKSLRFKLNTYKGNPQPEPNSEEISSSYSSNSEETLRFAGNLYKCNLCEIAFAENAFLLTHLKNKHRSTVSKALKPHFSCGACPAKFFKNSFLVKHCEFHEKTRQ